MTRRAIALALASPLLASAGQDAEDVQNAQETAGPPAAPGIETTIDVPSVYVQGQPYRIDFAFEAGAEGGQIHAWQASAAAFELVGEPLLARGEGAVELTPGGRLRVSVDLGSLLMAKSVKNDFELAFDGPGGKQSFDVRSLLAAPTGLNFLEMPADQLDDYLVLLKTNRGPLLIEFYPEDAPKHVQNFLDLAYTDFYDGTLFHRVSPAFMIQGGCPNTKTTNAATWGRGNGPRKLNAEFSERKHVRGILSAARTQDPNSATCQFFLMSVDYPSLDNKYSVFGKLMTGYDTLDKIANAPGPPTPGDQLTVRPDNPQRIEEAIVLQAPQGS